MKDKLKEQAKQEEFFPVVAKKLREYKKGVMGAKSWLIGFSSVKPESPTSQYIRREMNAFIKKQQRAAKRAAKKEAECQKAASKDQDK